MYTIMELVSIAKDRLVTIQNEFKLNIRLAMYHRLVAFLIEQMILIGKEGEGESSRTTEVDLARQNTV